MNIIGVDMEMEETLHPFCRGRFHRPHAWAATQGFEETGGWIMEKGKKLFSILFRVLSTLFVVGASYVALAGTFGIGKVWRCVLLLLAWALLNEDAIRLLWNHWRKGTALDWQTPTMVSLLIAAFAYVVCCVAIGISG